MVRVKVFVPDIDTPYFESTLHESDYDKFNKFLDELDSKFGEGNIACSADVVNDDEETKEVKQSDPIAEHIKDHPIINKDQPIDDKLKNFFDELDKVNDADDVDKLDNINRLPKDSEEKIEEPEEDDDEFNDKEFCKVLVNVKEHIISDIYYRENPELKLNAVDMSYPILDEVFKQIVVPIPLTVLEKCTAYNIAQFIKQNTIFILMDSEYCDIHNDNLDKVFDINDFDDSYCYDTGIYKITFDSVQFPCCPVDKDPCNICVDLFKHGQILDIVNNSSVDYREMEKIYTKLRLFNTED